MIAKLAGLILFSPTLVLHLLLTASAAGPITVQSLTYEGSGCPPGSASTVIAPDGSTFSILFDSHLAELEPTVPKKKQTRECIVDALLQAPVGWSWAIIGVDHRGFVAVPSGASATLKSSFQFNRQRADHRQAPPLEADFHGPIFDDYLRTMDTPPLQVDWSECGGTSQLHIKTRLEVRAAGPGGSGLLTLDSLDGQLTPLDGTSVCGYRLVWRRCD